MSLLQIKEDFHEIKIKIPRVETDALLQYSNILKMDCFFFFARS